MTGLAHASGELIFLIDSDLEEEPEWLLSFDKQMRAEDCDVVYGIQVKRKGGFFEKITGSLFYKIYQIFTSISLPNNPTTARLMTRRYVEALLLHKEREVIIAPLWAITGFIQSQQVVYKKSHSPTTYSISRRISLLVNAITSFSSLPLVFTFYSGLFIFISALFVILLYLIKYFTISSIPSGYTSTILSIWLFSGLIIFFLGVQGIYISTVFSEVKKRPYTIIRQIYQNTND
jgi:putative glycosyltransferase